VKAQIGASGAIGAGEAMITSGYTQAPGCAKWRDLVAKQAGGGIKVAPPIHQLGIESRHIMALVLCTGVDPVLVKTRQLILEKAGHKVVTALDEPTVIKVCAQQKFDVAVIGQAISRPVKRRIMNLVRENCPSAKILELYRYSLGKVLEDADSWLEVPTDVPQDLAERVSVLARGEKPQPGD
jgi:CheY-like chemotaxis protein